LTEGAGTSSVERIIKEMVVDEEQDMQGQQCHSSEFYGRVIFQGQGYTDQGLFGEGGKD
jgi:hypothetical protein